MSTKIMGNAGVVADVTSNRELQIRPTLTPANAGYVNAQSVNDAGTITGTPYVKSDEISTDFRNRVGIDTILDYELFNYTNQRTNKHYYVSSTMGISLLGNTLTTNSAAGAAGINTTNTGAVLKTWRFFPLYTASATYCEFHASLTAIPATNTYISFGLFQPSASAPYTTQVDGVGFRWTPSGLLGFQNINGLEPQNTSVFTFTPILGTVYHYVISISQEIIEFYINDVLYGTLIPSVGYGQPQLAGSEPLSIVHSISASGAAGNICQMKFVSYCVSLADWQTAKPWAHQMAGMAYNGNLLPEGNASGSYQAPIYPAYNAVIGTTVPTTTSSTATGLGGRTQFALVATANSSEYMLFNYQVPVGSATVTGRNLYIVGVRITSMVTTILVAPTAGANCIQLDLGFGATSVSNATTDSTTFASTTTKAYRKIPLGVQAWGTTGAAPLGTVGNDVDVKFNAPFLVNPGEWITIIAREMNTGAGGLISMGCFFDCYWE